MTRSRLDALRREVFASTMVSVIDMSLNERDSLMAWLLASRTH